MPYRALQSLCVTALLLVSGLAQASEPPKPFRAEYEVRRNGTLLGNAVMEWKSLGGERWQLSTTTNGAGLASVAGARVSEVSVLSWKNGVPETLSYEAQQDVAWRSSSRSLEPQPARGKILLSDRKGSLEIPYRAGFVDRHAFLVLLMAESAAGKDDIPVDVAERQGISTHRYRSSGQVTLETALGAQRALEIERIRRDDDGRSSQLWLSPRHGWIPLKLVQREPDGDVLEMRVLKF